MTINFDGINISKQNKEIVNRFEQAVRKHELLGSLPPSEWDDIRTEYHEAKKRLLLILDESDD